MSERPWIPNAAQTRAYLDAVTARDDVSPVRVEDLPPWPCCGAHGHHTPGCDGCVCPPCPGRGNDGHGLSHCAECCMGTGVEADLDCPVHGWAAVRG